MKTFMEEYGKIVVSVIVIMLFVVVAGPLGTQLKDGVKMTVDKFTQSMVVDEDEGGQDAGVEELVEINKVATYSTYYISKSGNLSSLKTSDAERFRLNEYAVFAGQTYKFKGTAKLADNLPIALFKTDSGVDANGTVLFEGTKTMQDYDYDYTPDTDGYVYIAQFSLSTLFDESELKLYSR